MSGAPFSFLTPGRIEFGRGTRLKVAQIALNFGKNILLVRGRSVPWVDTLDAQLHESGCLVTSVHGAGEPTVKDVQEAVRISRKAGINVVVAVGGGAILDLGKAIAAVLPGTGDVMDHLEGVGCAQPLFEDPLPFIAVPTTSGTGAEVTKNAVITVPEAGRKVSLRDNRMLPEVAIIDPALTDGAPRGQTLASGLDALTQVIEPYVSNRANPLSDAICRAAIPVGVQALAQLECGENAQARDTMAFVSLSGGVALANAGLGAVHGLAGVLGGRLGAPHGLICGRLMGPVLAANTKMIKKTRGDLSRFEEVALWLGRGFEIDADTVFETLPELLDDWNVPRLGQWVGPQIDLELIAREAAGASSMKANPCVLNVAALTEAMRLAL